jgi:uncharacterized protein
MSEDKQTLIQYRLSQAKDSIREAEVLLGGGMSFRSVMNRLYYALFYAVLALLQGKKIGTSKHTGAIALFDREFIKSGTLDKSLSRILHRAFELRQKADYNNTEQGGLLPAASRCDGNGRLGALAAVYAARC